MTISSLRDRLTLSVETHGEVTARLLSAALIIGSITGSYFVGKKVERHWWRTEIASKSAAVKTIMGQLAEDAPGFDERLIQEWSRENVATLRAAERKLQEAQDAARSAPAPQPDDPCRPVPAHCLLGGSRGGPAAGPAAGR